MRITKLKYIINTNSIVVDAVKHMSVRIIEFRGL